MKKRFKFFALNISFLLLLACSKEDDKSVAIRNHEEQYLIDIANIEEFMKTHYLTVVNHPGYDDDLDVTYTKITSGGTQVSIWDQTTYPVRNRIVNVTQNNVTIAYKIYYLELRTGTGLNGSAPCNVDDVLTSFRGEYIYKRTETVDGVTTNTILGEEFEDNRFPQSFLPLSSVRVKGFAEIFPKLKSGDYNGNPDGTITYFNFGAGIVFIPSGLAYYNQSTPNIPVYSPLVFNVKLYEVQRADFDEDGVPSYLEDLNNDGYIYTFPSGTINPDDTDGDGIPDFRDIDDDNDQFLTKFEIKDLVTNTVYPFESIPTCGTNGNGKKRYLDPFCHN